MIYEVQVQERKKDEQLQPKKKVLVFKASSDSEDSDDEEEDMAMITRKFRNFLRKSKFNKFKDANEVPLCFKCNKAGHIRKIVPYLNQKSTSTALTNLTSSRRRRLFKQHEMIVIHLPPMKKKLPNQLIYVS